MKNKLLLFFIIFLAAILRFYQLGAIPGSLNQDEASLGYNAYSLLKTGLDEHGKFLPLSLEAFGDWKLPVYPLVAVPFISLFDLNEISIRLPSALAGIIGVFICFKITEILFKDRLISLLSALFFAISPWSIYFSRAAYEVNLATTIFLGGFYFLILHLKNGKSAKNLLFASILFGLTLFTYHSFILFIPLFLLCVVIVFYKKLNFDRWTVAAGIVITFFVCVSFANLISNSSSKVSTLFIFNNPNVIYNRADKIKTDKSNGNPLVEKILYNKYYAVLYQFGQNYIQTFSPVFLFDKGGEKLQHNLGTLGNLYLIDAFLLLIGIIIMIRYREKSVIFLLPWLLVGPIPSSLTTDTPNSTRLFLLFPLFIIVMAYGVGRFIKILQKRRFFTLYAIGLTSLVFISFIYFLDAYFVHFNVERMRFWRYGDKQAVLLSQAYPTYDIVMRGPEDFHYIYFLFYEKYDPNKFRKEVVYYPRTKEGFLYVKSFGRYAFPDDIGAGKVKHNTVYIDDRGINKLSATINLISGEPIFRYTISGDEKK